MTQQEIDAVLRPTIDDLKITPSEKKSLQDWLTNKVTAEADRNLVRSHAFKLAKEKLTPSNGAGVLEWVEGIIRVMGTNASASAAAPAAAVRSEVEFGPNVDCSNMIVRHLRNAKRTIEICVFTISYDKISKEILLAHRRGVKVRIITDDEKIHDAGSDILEFKANGIPVRMDRDKSHMHHKFAIFDQAILLNGSYNWTRNASLENHENVVETNDPTLIRKFLDQFESLWKKWEKA